MNSNIVSNKRGVIHWAEAADKEDAPILSPRIAHELPVIHARELRAPPPARAQHRVAEPLVPPEPRNRVEALPAVLALVLPVLVALRRA